MRTKAKAAVVSLRTGPTTNGKTEVFISYWKDESTYSHTRRVKPSDNQFNKIRVGLGYGKLRQVFKRPLIYGGENWLEVAYLRRTEAEAEGTE